jgi:ectoine hydroxylase-related dioxygenase (phytanoyl-CoA dioxygenase family)
MIVNETRAIAGDVEDAYDRDGVICFRQLVSADWVALLREAVEMALRDESIPGADKAAKAGKAGRFVGQGALFQRFPRVREFVVQSPLAEVAARITRSRQVRIFDDGLFVKEPSTDVRTPWHHDIPYEQIEGMQTASAWVALDYVSAESGAVRYVAGSHKWGKLFIPVEFGTELERPHRTDDRMIHMPDIDAEPERYRIVTFDMQPGDVTFHNLRTVHGAGGNTLSDRRRRAYTLRMCGDDVVGCQRPVNGRPEAVVRDGEPLNDRDFPILWPNPGLT